MAFFGSFGLDVFATLATRREAPAPVGKLAPLPAPLPRPGMPDPREIARDISWGF